MPERVRRRDAATASLGIGRGVLQSPAEPSASHADSSSRPFSGAVPIASVTAAGASAPSVPLMTVTETFSDSPGGTSPWPTGASTSCTAPGDSIDRGRRHGVGREAASRRRPSPRRRPAPPPRARSRVATGARSCQKRGRSRSCWRSARVRLRPHDQPRFYGGTLRDSRAARRAGRRGPPRRGGVRR